MQSVKSYSNRYWLANNLPLSAKMHWIWCACSINSRNYDLTMQRATPHSDNPNNAT